MKLKKRPALVNKMDEIIYESATCRDWLKDLAASADDVIDKGGLNVVLGDDPELSKQFAELKRAHKALKKAISGLLVVQLAVERRETF